MRPAGGYTPDMINYANSVDMYQIWADMIAFDERRHQYGEEKFYCAAAGRRDGVAYAHSHEEMMEHYGANVKLSARVPQALSAAMGNHMYLVNFDTLEEVNEFLKFATEK